MNIKKLTTRQILEQNRSRTLPAQMEKCTIILHNVRSMYNVGAVFRNADAFGIRKLYLTGFTPAPPRPEISKTAIGAEKFVEWDQSREAVPLINRLKKENTHLIGVEQTTKSVDLPEFKPPRDKKLGLVFGNEVTGIQEDLYSHLDTFVEIPQYGNKHSLNVSVTTGILLYGMLQKFWNS